MTSIQDLLAFTLQAGASDLYLSSGAPIMVRMHGDVRRLDVPGVPADGVPAAEVSRMLLSVLPEAARERLANDLEIDIAVSVGSAGRFRVNVFQLERGLGVVFRTIPVGIPTIDPWACRPWSRALRAPHGLVLITGPTARARARRSRPWSTGSTTSNPAT
jgi:twitching motility protein PilT